MRWEINGSKGSLAFDLERLNELQVSPGPDATTAEAGLRTILVSEGDHPFWQHLAARHVIGWEHTFVHELHHSSMRSPPTARSAPYGATFEDGTARRRSATRSSAPTRRAREALTYRTV